MIDEHLERQHLKGETLLNPDMLENGWRAALTGEFSRPYMAALESFLRAELAAGKHIYPRVENWFRAMELVPYDQVRVVILGQDPYHGPDQAHGLCFSVQPGVKTPPSLVNIYKELQSDLGISPAKHGFLESWARQGVLLLNSVLTVEAGKAASHAKRGWERFTDAVIHAVAARPEPTVFMLWGGYAQRKAAFLQGSQHLILQSAHPSPLSAYAGFFGNSHFSRANAFLQRHGRPTVNWRLPDQA